MSCVKRELQSLLGLLLYITKCVKYARFFLNRMLDCLKSAPEKGVISLTPQFHQDLAWFNKFLVHFNGTTFFDHRKITNVFEVDACLQGLGARCDDQVYYVPIQQGYNALNICHLERLNILVALRIWGCHFSHKKLIIKYDNEASVSVLNTGRTKDPTLAAIYRWN